MADRSRAAVALRLRPPDGGLGRGSRRLDLGRVGDRDGLRGVRLPERFEFLQDELIEPRAQAALPERAPARPAGVEVLRDDRLTVRAGELDVQATPSHLPDLDV